MIAKSHCSLPLGHSYLLFYMYVYHKRKAIIVSFLQATGSRVGTLIETLVGALLALGIALYYSWLMTIVILLVAPLVMVAGALQLKALTTHASSNKKKLEVAGRISVDSVENIRTVASLTVEENFYQQYKAEVKKPYR